MEGRRRGGRRLHSRVECVLTRRLHAPLSLVATPLGRVVAGATFPRSFLRGTGVTCQGSVDLRSVYGRLLGVRRRRDCDPGLGITPCPTDIVTSAMIHTSRRLLGIDPVGLRCSGSGGVGARV